MTKSWNICTITIHHANGNEKTYKADINPWPTDKMLTGLAIGALKSEGGTAVEYHGPNGLQGFITAEDAERM